MEHSAKGFAAIVQLLSEPVHDPTKSAAAWQRPVCLSHQPVQKRAEIVCPKPVRPVRAPPCLVDRPRSSILNMTFQIQAAAEMELLDFLLGGQDGDFESDDDQGRFFLGTPPARTGNPIVNDAEFRKQSLAAPAAGGASPVKHLPYPTTALPPTPKGQKGTGSYPPSSSALSTVPNTTRIVGFPSACSDPHARRRVVSALA